LIPRFAMGSEKMLLKRLIVCSLAWACCCVAEAVLVHRYTFNGSANDSVGTAHGTVVDPGNPTAVFANGLLDLSANTGQGSTAISEDAYVDLPNGIVSAAAAANGAVTFEFWASVATTRTWQRFGDFGASNNGENTSASGAMAQYVMITPNSGRFTNGLEITNHPASNAAEPSAGVTGPFPTGSVEHVVAVYDQSIFEMRLYHNGALVDFDEIHPDFDLTAPVDNNNWLGRSQWPDPVFDGSYDEFRIYNHALTDAEVTASFTTGPTPPPQTVLLVNRDTGTVSLSSQANRGTQIKAYSVTSAAGALNPTTWTSIDADNSFDPDGTWTAQSSTSTNLAESVTGGTLDGGTLPQNSPRPIGTPWIKSPFEDLVFSFTTSDNVTQNGLVQYTGHGGARFDRSDLNGDGSVNVADWSLFIPNSFTTFATDTRVAAYLKGDLDGDKDNDYADFELFKTDFIAVNGAAAFAQLSGVVPEPSTIVLAVVAFSLLGSGFRRAKW
jgi:hypothetical protein